MKRRRIAIRLLSIIGLIAAGCVRNTSGAQPAVACTKTGVEVLREDGFDILKGKRVGLITNPTGVDRHLKSTIDILHEASQKGILELAALYGPEHGVRGNVPAGEYVSGGRDPKTGITVHSLYGKTRKPTPEMLKGIDVLVFDIQDIGSRSYTYISTMGLAMEAAGENQIEFVVLDRPNPLGGLRVNGSEKIKTGFKSFVSQYPIPYVHGMTVGELAEFFNEEGLLKNKIKCDLTVVEMENWDRDMTWADTGLPWVPTSPHIPTAESAVCYPATGIVGEMGTVHIGVGYTLPFQLMGAEWIDDADRLADRLNRIKELQGVHFRPIHYKPFYGGKKDKDLHGVQIYVESSSGTPLPMISFYVLQELATLYPQRKTLEAAQESQINMFDKVLGTDQIRKTFIQNGYLVDEAFKKLWEPSAEFMNTRHKYLLY